MRTRLVIALACLLGALACGTGGGVPPSGSQADDAIRDSQAPCMGNADGECPSGNPLNDF